MTAIAVLGIVLGFAVLNGGALESRELNICLLVLGIVGVVYGRLTRHRSPVPPTDPRTLHLTMAVLGVVLLQLVPLPVAVVGLISPSRAGLLRPLVFSGDVLHYATLSIVPAVTLRYLMALAACTIVFFLVREISWRHDGNPWLLAVPFLVVAFLEAVIGIAQHSAQGTAGIALGTFENRNHYAGFLEMSLPFAVMFGVTKLIQQQRHREFRTRAALVACCILSVAATIFLGVLWSLSRMGFFAALSSLFVIAATGLSRGRSARRTLLVVGSLVAVFVVLILILPSDSMIFRFAAPVSTGELNPDDRLQIWQDTLRLIAAYPLVGCGLGGYESGLMQYKTAAPMFTVNFAHNDYLQLSAEVGAPGIILLLWLGVRVAGFAWRATNNRNRLEEKGVALACLGSFVAILLHSLVDFNLYVHSNAMLLAWVAGLASGPLDIPEHGDRLGSASLRVVNVKVFSRSRLSNVNSVRSFLTFN